MLKSLDSKLIINGFTPITSTTVISWYFIITCSYEFWLMLHLCRNWTVVEFSYLSWILLAKDGAWLVDLHFLNPYCVFLIVSSSVLAIRICTMLANILYAVCDKEIGL